MRPRDLVQAWVEAFNRADPDALAAFYTEDAVNHQVAESPVHGREAIRRMFASGFATATMHCIVEHVFEDGEWAILEWRDPLGLRGCGFFHVLDGKIVFQRGYWDKLSFLHAQGLPVPDAVTPARPVPDVVRNKAIVRAFADAVNARDWDRLGRLVAPDFVRHSHSAPPVRGRDELQRYLRDEFETFPDGHETVEDILAEGDRVAVRHAFRGTQDGWMGPYPPSGKRMAADYLAIYRIANGVIVEAWVEWDNLAGLVQLGHATPPGA